ncbi:hypothetical protein [Bacillus sp. FJAT-52991]|uniref:Uncharacterized protein n=1 Tax=Bacillus kandeliae TaxID=3129297 RepID=A0ABZ2N2Q8_9BACI
MPAGTSVSKQEKVAIRRDLRSVLKSMDRETLLATWYGFGWGWAVREQNAEKMNQAKVVMAGITDEQIMRLILDRDVQGVVNTLEKGYW